jgi:hypothetical protein
LGFLVREEDLNYIKEYGNGIKIMTCVGELFELPTEKSECIR